MWKRWTVFSGLVHGREIPSSRFFVNWFPLPLSVSLDKCWGGIYRRAEFSITKTLRFITIHYHTTSSTVTAAPGEGSHTGLPTSRSITLQLLQHFQVAFRGRITLTTSTYRVRRKTFN